MRQCSSPASVEFHERELHAVASCDTKAIFEAQLVMLHSMSSCLRGRFPSCPFQADFIITEFSLSFLVLLRQ